uniref:integrase core domain-containing protein n=1 Tax=Lentzea kristufekii TaxID=3095430 RepID=UPI0038736176
MAGPPARTATLAELQALLDTHQTHYNTLRGHSALARRTPRRPPPSTRPDRRHRPLPHSRPPRRRPDRPETTVPRRTRARRQPHHRHPRPRPGPQTATRSATST